MEVLRLALAGLLLAHGLMHVSFMTPAPPGEPGGQLWPFNLDRSWLLTRLHVHIAAAVRLGRILVVLTLLAFAVTAFGLMTSASWWGVAAVVAAAISSVQLSVWFHWWLPVGLLINVVLIAAVLGRWDAVTQLGA